MSERSEYAPGTPCWVDIGTDVEGAKAFYGGLFGWEAQDAGPVEETGGYGFFLKNGKQVAGYGPQQTPGPPVWASYVWVDNVDETAKRAESAGGTVMVTMDVMAAGRMAVVQDTEGAFISLWQPGEHRGAQVVNEPVSLCWNELNTRDVPGAKSFYSEVFGWEPVSYGEGADAYTEFQVGGKDVAGMREMAGMPAQVPPHWLVYFAVADTDATVARAQELGGSVLFGPMDIRPGRFAVLHDPQGANFAVIKVAVPDS
jgi:predicted enzyme related to lactoylglutathione lyase